MNNTVVIKLNDKIESAKLPVTAWRIYVHQNVYKHFSNKFNTKSGGSTLLLHNVEMYKSLTYGQYTGIPDDAVKIEGDLIRLNSYSNYVENDIEYTVYVDALTDDAYIDVFENNIYKIGGSVAWGTAYFQGAVYASDIVYLHSICNRSMIISISNVIVDTQIDDIVFYNLSISELLPYKNNRKLFDNVYSVGSVQLRTEGIEYGTITLNSNQVDSYIEFMSNIILKVNENFNPNYGYTFYANVDIDDYDNRYAKYNFYSIDDINRFITNTSHLTINLSGTNKIIFTPVPTVDTTTFVSKFGSDKNVSFSNN